ncbi:TPA: hypothetical protein ACIX8S_005241, partial [Escherichia coli]
MALFLIASLRSMYICFIVTSTHKTPRHFIGSIHPVFSHQKYACAILPAAVSIVPSCLAGSFLAFFESAQG